MRDFSKYSDQELAAFLRSGDAAAFKAIYKKYWDKLLVVAGKRLDDLHEAEEVLQDIFLNLWLRRADFQLRISFDNYFAVAVKFQIINRLAKRSRESSRNKAFAIDRVEATEPVAIQFDLALLKQQVSETIDALPSKCQLVFKMSREQDMSNKEIAKTLEISEKTVEKHMTSALKTLRTRFGNLLPVLMLLIRN
uniref:RNA polymerase sigma-70 factor n=1 Tax=Pedobacter schmidteae TaxID=2201271 RepID=UPI000EADF97E|nr:RNA polymerase sigma-70 factor [Pedobacter schmidteae]